MVLQEQLRRFVSVDTYQRKDKTAGATVSCFCPEDASIERYYMGVEDAKQFGFVDAHFGDIFSTDLSVSTTQFGTKITIERAHLSMTCLEYEQSCFDKESKKGGK